MQPADPLYNPECETPVDPFHLYPDTRNSVPPQRSLNAAVAGRTIVAA